MDKTFRIPVVQHVNSHYKTSELTQLLSYTVGVSLATMARRVLGLRMATASRIWADSRDGEVLSLGVGHRVNKSLPSSVVCYETSTKASAGLFAKDRVQ